MRCLRMFLGTAFFMLFLFGIIIIYKNHRLVRRVAKTKQIYRPSLPHRYMQDDKTMEIKDRLLKSTAITIRVYSKGVIDTRTERLANQTLELLQESDWFLLGQCDCDSPIWNSIVDAFQPFEPFGRTVSIDEYWSQVYNSRTIVTLCHKDAVKESGGKGKISLLTQGTPSRRHMLRHLIDNWPGPINAALYVNHQDFEDIYNFIKTLLVKSKRRNVILHIVLSTGCVYPVNWLRNLVIKNATSEYILSIDIDFIPSKNLMDKIIFHLTNIKGAAANKAGLIVPALEMLQNTSEALPLTKPGILSMVSSGNVDIFQRSSGGHTFWLFDKWLASNKSYLLPRYSICDDHSEPYVVLPLSTAPLYPETLLERGKNKIAYYHELCTDHYTFLVIDDGFLLHKWHPYSLRALKRVTYCIKEAFTVFKLQLNNSARKLYFHEYVMSASTMRLLLGLKCIFIDFIIFGLFISPFLIVFMWYFR